MKKSFAVLSVSALALAAGALVAYCGLNWYASEKARAAWDATISEKTAGTPVRVTYGQAWSSVLGPDLAVTDIVIRTENLEGEISLKSLLVHDYEPDKGIINVEMKGGQLELDPASLRALDLSMPANPGQFGREINFDLSFSSKPETGIGTRYAIEFESEGLAGLSVDLNRSSSNGVAGEYSDGEVVVRNLGLVEILASQIGDPGLKKVATQMLENSELAREQQFALEARIAYQALNHLLATGEIKRVGVRFKMPANRHLAPVETYMTARYMPLDQLGEYQVDID